MNIYVGNLSRTISEDALRKLFETFGAVTTVRLIKDKFTGEARGFGFVDMADDAQAKQAIDQLNNSEFEGQMLRVNEARPQEKRFDRGGGSRSGGGGGGRFRDSSRGPRSGGYSNDFGRRNGGNGGGRSRDRFGGGNGQGSSGSFGGGDSSYGGGDSEY